MFSDRQDPLVLGGLVVKNFCPEPVVEDGSVVLIIFFSLRHPISRSRY